MRHKTDGKTTVGIARPNPNMRAGVHCNDRKFEQWSLSVIGKGEGANAGKAVKKAINLQVYAVPKGNNRGAETEHFKVVINGIVIASQDLAELRRKAVEVFTGLVEADYQKVLIVKTRGRSSFREGQEQGDEFGLEWLVGWKAPGLDVVLSENRGWTINVENYDEPEEEVPEGGLRLGGKPGYRGKQDHKTAVIPWSQEREDILKKAVEAIGKMRDDLNQALLQPESFAGLLDARAGVLLLEGKSKPASLERQDEDF